MKNLDCVDRNELIKFLVEEYWRGMLVAVPFEDEPSYLFYLEDGGIIGRECVVMGTYEDLWDNPYYSEAVIDWVHGGGAPYKGATPGAVLNAVLEAVGTPSYTEIKK